MASEITREGDIVATVCGRCGHVRGAHWLPDFCGACRARFDLGAPVALLRLHVHTSSRHGAPELSPRYEAEFLGPWDARVQRDVEEALGSRRADG